MGVVADTLQKKLVKRSGKSVTELAKELGIGRPALSNVINGNADLSMELAIKLEIQYGINASKLLNAQLAEGLAQIRAQMDEVDDD